MSFEEFRESLDKKESPPGLNPLLEALWFDAKGDWKAAHEVAQEIETKDGSWVHAYLHRKEGDEANAAYWYRKAMKPFPSISLEGEWNEITKALLQ